MIGKDLYYKIDTQDSRGFFYAKDKTKLHELNQQGYGIFWTVNDFPPGERKEINIQRINAWYVDIDGQSKNEVMKNIGLYLRPSLVIETKNGIHAYWFCKEDGLIYHDVQGYKSFLKINLRSAFNSCPNSSDASRVLRAPFYLHMKEPADPFLVKPLWEEDRTYDFDQMAKAFPENIRYKIIETEARKISGDDFWVKVGHLNCEEALMKFSGSSVVRGETFTFRFQAGGKKNIYVNGKSTSCWIDTDGLIGSNDRGGPTIAQWLKWYGNSYKEIMKELLRIYPQLGEKH
jgi:hypothetical protein